MTKRGIPRKKWIDKVEEGSNSTEEGKRREKGQIVVEDKVHCST